MSLLEEQQDDFGWNGNSSNIDVDIDVDVDVDAESSFDDDRGIGADAIDSGCDESKCVSKGRSYLFGGASTCYGDERIVPRMCADGFLPAVVETEPEESTVFWGREYPVSYFTCCPPPPMPERSFYYDDGGGGDDATTNATAIATRRCSDPIPAIATTTTTADDDFIGIGICDDDPEDRRHPRRMKPSMGVLSAGVFGIFPSKTDAVICCDDPLPDENHIGEVDCVPYRSDIYEFKHATNLIGLLRVVSCDFPDGSFTVPRPLEGMDVTDVELTGRYRCCRNGTPLEPYIKNDVFETTIYVPLSLWIIATAASVIVVVSLMLPLWIELRNMKNSDAPSSRSHFDTIRTVREKRAPTYSTYNIYVVYLALFDLIYGLLQIGMYASIVDQKYNPNFQHIVASPSSIYYVLTIFRSQDTPLIYTMININMWINAVIAYQILDLLRTSRTARKIRQPSLSEVNKQVGLVCLLSIAYMALLYTLRHFSIRAGLAGEYDTVTKISHAIQFFYWAVQYTPVAFICGITFKIWWGGYVPSVQHGKSSTRDRAMRQLCFFFLRIIMVFFLLWVPITALVHYGTKHLKTVNFLIAQSLMAVQPILSTCMVLTKFDARKYVFDLISLSYCRGCRCWAKNKKRADDDDRSIPRQLSEDFIRNYKKPAAVSQLSASSVGGLDYTDEDNRDLTENTAGSYNGKRKSDRDSLYYSMLGFVGTDAENMAPEGSDEGSDEESDEESDDSDAVSDAVSDVVSDVADIDDTMLAGDTATE